MLNQFIRNISWLFFPPECEICARPLLAQSSDGVCPACRGTIHPIRSPHCPGCGRTVTEAGLRCVECQKENFNFDRVHACSHYEGAMRELLHLYKFKRRKVLKKFFLSLARTTIQSHLREVRFDAVVAVPIAPEKRRERGFNQAQLLSGPIAKDLKIPDASAVIKRVRCSAPQSSLRKVDRAVNVKGAFLVRGKNTLAAKNILLVDDILTTGQTASECARVLKNAGARSVSVLALARGF